MHYNQTRAATPLYIREADGHFRYATDDEILSVAEAAIEDRFIGRTPLNDPNTVRRYLVQHFAKHVEREVFTMILLDTQHRAIAVEDVSFGTIDGASIYPREIVKCALQHSASAVIFSHNHPSGIPEPSNADRMLTERLKAALATVDIRALDHIVVGGSNSVSFAERGWL